MMEFIRTFGELTPGEAALAGGKGAALARLTQAGLPIPAGFIILTTAFAGDELRPEAWEVVVAATARLRARERGLVLAVRSSAAQEDAAGTSFAGEFETILGVSGDASLLAAIGAVRRSGWAGRVQAYADALGAKGQQDLAVVVQRQVHPDVAGVLFTADPVSGDRERMVGNYVRGLGESLVSGEADATQFTLAHGRYDGPAAFRPAALRLRRLANRIAMSAGCPQDIEWALVGGKVFILQSRPITTLAGENPATGEINDSLTGDYVWSSTNLSEAIPSVMTPSTWSVTRMLQTLTGLPLPGCRDFIGNIAGRPYVNLSLLAGLGVAGGQSPVEAMRQSAGLFGDIPETMAGTVVTFTKGDLVRLIPQVMRWQRRIGARRRRLAQFVAQSPTWCARTMAQMGNVSSQSELAVILRDTVLPMAAEAYWTLRSVTNRRDPGNRLRQELVKLAGAADAEALLGASAAGESLASMGPLLGLMRVTTGELSPQDYLRQYGHRCPDEYELSAPRPVEQPGWLESQMAWAAEGTATVEGMLVRQREQHAAALKRLNEGNPRQAPGLRVRIADLVAETHQRELVRSELVRIIGVLRAGLVRAGELTSLGQDVFYLSFTEALAVLNGDTSAVTNVAARRATHARYSALPTYPRVIRGRFDPFAWAADPQRRPDMFDAAAPAAVNASAVGALSGAPASAGRVEGVVRVLRSPEEASALREGEILVTGTTNVGWTLAFPRCAAIITDVGAVLSHAAIVARELGIPAVLGCGDATSRLRTGDRVVVDGGRGLVEVLERRCGRL